MQIIFQSILTHLFSRIYVFKAIKSNYSFNLTFISTNIRQIKRLMNSLRYNYNLKHLN